MLIVETLQYFCRTEKIRFSGAQKSVLLKESLGEHCASHCVPRHAPNEICYGKMEQCNDILQFPHVSAERLSEKRKPRLCFLL